MPGVALILGATGAVLLYAAFKGLDPRSLFTSVFTGNPPTPLPPLPGADSAANTSPLPATQPGNPASVGGGATPACAKFVAALKATFGNEIQGTGIVSVRNIAGTSEPSQHSFGNAVDITATDKEAVWRWAIRNNVRYSVRVVIYNRRSWSRGGIAPYTGSNPHTDHVHVDFYPQYCPPVPGHPCGIGESP